MPVEQAPNGTRRVHVEVEVSGTPEEVWRAIATGPGVSSWFVDTCFDGEGAGVPSSMRNDFGPGMESVSEIRTWDPPHRFTAASRDLGADAPEVGTEWSVEPLANGGCTVRVTHEVLTDATDWDAHLAAWESGWPAFFHLLQLALAHHRGEPSASFQLSATAGEASAAWDRLAAGLGLSGIERGAKFSAPDTTPTLAGTVERDVEPNERVLRLERPTPGIAHLFAMPMGANSALWLRLGFFGKQATETAVRERTAWKAWIDEQFPAQQS